VITTDQELVEFLARLAGADWVAVDTEADSLHAYPEKLCLMQISIPGEDHLVDPLARIDLTPLLAVLRGHEIIMHGSDYDLRLLRKNYGFVPERIFDTMLASRLIGDREFGLVNLAQNYLGVTLEKGSQKADWAKRPLTPKMEVYARNDTHFLHSLAQLLREKLVALNRLDWHRETCNRLIAACAVATRPEPDLVWRLKGAHRLSRAGLAVLRELWHWRETEAIAVNKPPYFVMPHEALVDVASAVSEHREHDPLLPHHFSSRRREEVAKAVERAQALAPESYPLPRRSVSRRQSETERKRFEQLEQRRVRLGDAADRAQCRVHLLGFRQQRIDTGQPHPERAGSVEGGHQLMVDAAGENLEHGVHGFRRGDAQPIDEAAFDAAFREIAGHLLAAAVNHHDGDAALAGARDLSGQGVAQFPEFAETRDLGIQQFRRKNRNT